MGDRNYEILVKNFSSRPKGLKISGKDRGGNDFVRYTSIINRGENESLIIYLPRRTQVRMREVLTCEKADGGCVNATFGPHQVVIRIR